MKLQKDIDFRLLTEYHSFLLEKMKMWRCKKCGGFPSPYGVSFILMQEPKNFVLRYIHTFPSPYGVSFILMLIIKIIQIQLIW